MLLSYIDNKLNDEDRVMVESHLQDCSSCYNKYLEMKDIVKNLHFEYEKLLNDFERIETNQMFNIREYETFYKNISPYIDDELSYDDSIKFRKYLLKSKPARAELANAYNLRNNIRHSATIFKDNLNVNFSKKIIRRLKDQNKYSFDTVYRRAVAIIGIMVTALVLISFAVGFGYFGYSVAKAETVAQTADPFIDFPDDMVEFTFDYGPDAMLVDK